jgi:hypothetical protein
MRHRALAVGVLSFLMIGAYIFPVGAVMNGEVQPENKWVVAITIKNGNRAQLCSGVLIRPNTVITAKHCAINSKGKRFPKIEINAPGSRFNFPHTSDMEMREVTKVIPVKEPKNKWNDDEGDVAFLKFDRPFTNFELPSIGTPAQIASLKPWSIIKGYGYGTTGDGLSKYSHDPLRYQLSWGNDDHAVLGTVVLIASVTSMACSGDSGGPVTAFLEDNQEILIGVAASIANKSANGCEKINPTKMYYMNFNFINSYLIN